MTCVISCPSGGVGKYIYIYVYTHTHIYIFTDISACSGVCLCTIFVTHSSIADSIDYFLMGRRMVVFRAGVRDLCSHLPNLCYWTLTLHHINFPKVLFIIKSALLGPPSRYTIRLMAVQNGFAYIYLYYFFLSSFLLLFYSACTILTKRMLLLLLFTPFGFFTSVLGDGFSLEFKWQQVSSSLQDSSQDSGRSQQCCRLDSLYPSANFQVLQDF